MQTLRKLPVICPESLQSTLSRERTQTGVAHRCRSNIVLVSGNRIAPAATGGQVRSISIARALARIGHSVHIFSTAGRREDYRAANLRRGMTMESAIEPRLKESTHLGLTFGITQ